MGIYTMATLGAHKILVLLTVSKTAELSGQMVVGTRWMLFLMATMSI